MSRIDIVLEGVSVNKCPFCGTVPSIKLNEYPIHGYMFEILCTDDCILARTRAYLSLTKLLKKWNAKRVM